MNPSNILFSSFSALTGGLVTDLTTTMLALLGVGFVVMGFDYLREAFEARVVQPRKDEMDYQKYKSKRDVSIRNKVRYENESQNYNSISDWTKK